MELQFVTKDKNMSLGLRMFGNRELTFDEISIVRKAICEIEADESVFVFNDMDHLMHTCYVAKDDKVYIGCDVFPDTDHGSIHPRDLMSIRAVLAHEYYGHRLYREEYLNDELLGVETTPEWKDESRASRTAAQKAPGLTQMDRANLCQDAVFRAHEYGFEMEIDSFMKEAVWGYGNSEKYFTRPVKIRFIRIAGNSGNENEWENDSEMPELWTGPYREDNGNVRSKGSRSL